MDASFPRRSARWLWVLVMLATVSRSMSVAAPPTLEHLYPVAVAYGEATNSVQAVGTFASWPVSVWVDDAAIHVLTETNSGKLRVTVSSNAVAGPHLIRLFNDEGASAPRFLVVAKESLTTEVEPNDEFKQPQQITALPGWVNGRLDRGGDVDSFGVSLARGETLIARVQCYLLGSPVDAALRIWDPSHVSVALNHDDGETFDPFLTWTAQQDGVHVVQVFGFPYPAGSDIRFTGGNSAVYRLWLSKGPYVHHSLPLGVSADQPSDLRWVGWNLKNAAGSLWRCPSQTRADDLGFAWVHPQGIESAVRVCVGRGPEVMEREPNDRVSEAGVLAVPSAVTGSLDPANDVDRYRLVAKPGDLLALRVQSAGLGFSLDAWLRIEDQDGKQLAYSDDANGADPALDFTVSGTNAVFAVVGNLLHRGMPDQFYRLSVDRVSPSLELVSSVHSFTLRAGETNEVKVTLKRSGGFNKKVTLTTMGLPSGVSSAPVEVGEQAGEAKLTWVVAASASKVSNPIRIVASPADGGQPVSARFSMVTSGSDNGVPNGFGKLLIHGTDQLWLTVVPTPPPSPPSTPKK